MQPAEVAQKQIIQAHESQPHIEPPADYLPVEFSENGPNNLIPSKPGTAGENYRKIVESIPGKIASEFDAMNPGPLGNDMASVAATFSGGRYATITLDRSLVAYRAWAKGQSREFGGFWSL
jgi:hypothetical protein